MLTGVEMVNISQYVPFVHFLEELPYRYVKHYMGYIKVYSNEISLLNYACYKSYIFSSIRSEKLVTGTVFVYVDSYLYQTRVDRDGYDADAYIPKSNGMYIENVYNKSYSFNDVDVQITHYPIPKISWFIKSSDMYCCIAHDYYDALLSMKTGVKTCLSSFCYNKKMCSVHAGGVEQNNGGILFFAPTRCGKTTLCMNLSANNYRLMNDDILFLFMKEDVLCAVGCPVMPNIRMSSSEFLCEDIKTSEIVYKNEKLGLLFCEGACESAVLIPHEVKNIYFLKRGFKYTQIMPLESEDVKTELVKSFVWHFRAEPKQHMMDMINNILNRTLFTLSISTDFSEILRKLIKEGGEK